MTNPKWWATLYFAVPMIGGGGSSGANTTHLHFRQFYGLSLQEVEDLKKFLADSGGGLYEVKSYYYKPGYYVWYNPFSVFVPAGKVLYAEFKEYDHVDLP